MPWHQGQVNTEPGITELLYIKKISDTGYLAKIFSFQEMSDDDLSRLLGESNVLEVQRKEWQSYPYAAPLKSAEDFTPLRLDDGLYNTAGMGKIASLTLHLAHIAKLV